MTDQVDISGGASGLPGEPGESGNPYQFGLTAVMVLIVGGITGVGTAIFGVLPSSRLAFTVPALAGPAGAGAALPVTPPAAPGKGG